MWGAFNLDSKRTGRWGTHNMWRVEGGGPHKMCATHHGAPLPVHTGSFLSPVGSAKARMLVEGGVGGSPLITPLIPVHSTPCTTSATVCPHEGKQTETNRTHTARYIRLLLRGWRGWEGERGRRKGGPASRVLVTSSRRTAEGCSCKKRATMPLVSGAAPEYPYRDMVAVLD